MPPNFNFPLCLINSLYHAAMNFSMLALSVKPEFELTFYQLGFDVVLHIGIVISVHVGEIYLSWLCPSISQRSCYKAS